MPSKLVTATEFKSHCLSLLDEIEERGETVTVTRRGRPVAVLGPVKKAAFKSPANSWAGRIEIFADLENLDISELWNVAAKEQDE